MQRQFNGIDANQAIVDFLMECGADLPEDSKTFIRNAVAGTDGLRAIIVTMETLYYSREDALFTDMCANMMCELAMFVRDHNFYGLSERAEFIRQVGQRILDGGENTMEGDPATSTTYAPTPPPPPPAPPEPMPEPAPEEGA